MTMQNNPTKDLALLKLVTTNYADSDLTFFMGMYQDLERAKIALQELRKHFSDARVVVRSDGDSSTDNRLLESMFDVEYYEETRLYPVENGGAMIQRVLSLYLENPTPYLIKLDTDTKVHRRFRYLPTENGVFGSLQKSLNGCFSIQGGCVGFSELAASAIVESGILNDARLKDPNAHRRESRYFARIGNRAKRCNLTSFDWVVGWAAYELEIPQFEFREIHSRGEAKHSADNQDLRYAMTHPVYFEQS